MGGTRRGWSVCRHIIIPVVVLFVSSQVGPGAAEARPGAEPERTTLRLLGGSLSDTGSSYPFKAWLTSEEIYVTDSMDSTLRRVSLSDGRVTTLAGRAGKFGAADGDGATARFGRPAGVWADENNIYVADAYYDTIRRISAATGEVTTLAGSSSGYGARDGIGDVARFRTPVGLWGDGRYLYVCDSLNFTIRKVDLATGEVTTLAGTARVRGLEDGIGSAARFHAPVAIWGDGEYLYVADGSAIRKVTIATGEVRTLAGRASSPGYADGEAGQARFSFASGIWGDGTRLFVADSGNDRIRIVSADTGFVTTLAATGGEDGSGGSRHFFGPMDVVGDGTAMYVLDSVNARIERAAVPSRVQAAVAGRAPSGGGTGGSPIRGLGPAGRPGPILRRPSGLSSTTSGAARSVQVGYARVLSSEAGAPPAGFALIGYRHNGILVSEAAIRGARPIQQGRIYADIQGAANTGLAISNPNPYAAIVHFYFTDADGRELYRGLASVPANGQTAGFLDQPPFAPPVHLEIDLSRARTFTFSSSLPVGVTALRGFVNERSEFLMTTLPVTTFDRLSRDPAILPHYADGGGWRTRLVLVNPTDVPVSGVVDFFERGQTGSPAPVSPGSATYAIPPRSAVTLRTSGEGTRIRTGWLRVTPSPGQHTPSGLVIFSLEAHGVTVSESGVEAPEQEPDFLLYAEASGEFDRAAAGSIRTGIAISNAHATAATVRFDLLTFDGTATGFEGSTTVPPQGQVAMFLDEIPGLEDMPVPFKGILQITGPPVAVTGLKGQYNGRGEFLIAATPPVAASRSEVSPLLFPHFADGGGYTTQFVLLQCSARQASDTTLSFVGRQGERLPLSIR